MRNGSRIVHAIVDGCVVSIIPLGSGIIDIYNLFQINVGHAYYYVNRSYSYGILVFIFGLMMAASGFYIVFKRRTRWLLFIPLVLTFLAIPFTCRFSPPCGYSHPCIESEISWALKLIRDIVCQWEWDHETLPKDQTELQKAVKEIGKKRLRGTIFWADDKDALVSLYARDGNRIPYEFVYIKNASGPYLTQPPPARPGVVYFAISQDRQLFWLTVTGLVDHQGNGVHVGNNVSYLKKVIVRSDDY